MVDASMLWSVDHLVEEVMIGVERVTPGSKGLMAKKEVNRRFTFDFEQAEREVAAAQTRLAYSPFVSSSTPRQTSAGMLLSRRGQGGMMLGDSMRRRERGSRQAVNETVVDLSSQLERVSMVESLAPQAEATAANELQLAVESEREVAALHETRTHAWVPVPAVEKRLPPLTRKGVQKCIYAGTRCAGCEFPIEKDSLMVPGGRGVCHDSDTKSSRGSAMGRVEIGRGETRRQNRWCGARSGARWCRARSLTSQVKCCGSGRGTTSYAIVTLR